MPLSAGDVLKCDVVHLFNGLDEQINSFHVQVGVMGTGDLSDYALDIMEHIGDAYDNIKDRISSLVNVVEFRLRNVTDDEPTQYFQWVSGAYTGGTGAGDPLPPQISALVLWRTGVKRVVGRTYLPVFTEANQSAGHLESAALAAVDNFALGMWGHWIGTETGAEFDFRIWSPTLNSVHEITSFRSQRMVAGLNRRKVGRGS